MRRYDFLGFFPRSAFVACGRSAACLVAHVSLSRILAVILLLAACASHAQTVSDPAYANMQRSVGGIIQSAAKASGYSATDPKTYSTLASYGKVAGTMAAGAGAGLLVGGTAPAWATVLGIAAASTIAGKAFDLATDAAVEWSVGSDGKVTSPRTSGKFSARTTNPNCIKETIEWGNMCFDPSTAVDLSGFTVVATQCQGSANPTMHCLGRDKSADGLTNEQRTAQAVQAAGLTFSPSSTQTQEGTLSEAVSALTEAQKESKVAYDAMALMVNAVLQQASAKDGYAGVPSPSVTAAQVEAWARANPSLYPTVRELTAPVTDPAGFQPVPQTTTGTDTGTDTGSGTGAGQTDCDKYPDIAGCQRLNVPDQDVPKTTRSITYQAEDLGFGGGTCPPPFTWRDSLGTHGIDLTPYCGMLTTYVRPVVIALALLAAVFIIMPGKAEA